MNVLIVVEDLPKRKLNDLKIGLHLIDFIMFKIFRTFLLILFLVSTTTAVYSETNWITKKSDKTKVELKKEKKEKKEKKKKWIANKKGK